MALLACFCSPIFSSFRDFFAELRGSAKSLQTLYFHNFFFAQFHSFVKLEKNICFFPLVCFLLVFFCFLPPPIHCQCPPTISIPSPSLVPPTQLALLLLPIPFGFARFASCWLVGCWLGLLAFCISISLPLLLLCTIFPIHFCFVFFFSKFAFCLGFRHSSNKNQLNFMLKCFTLFPNSFSFPFLFVWF